MAGIRENVVLGGGHDLNENFGRKQTAEEKSNVLSKRAEDGPSLHAFTSVSKLLTKIDLFFFYKGKVTLRSC